MHKIHSPVQKSDETAKYYPKGDNTENINYRCDKATEIGVTRLASVRCPTGLAFDIERQTCDWKTNVKNCDQIESKQRFTILLLKNAPFSFCSARTGARNLA